MKCPSCKKPLKEAIKNSENPKRFFSIFECEACKKKFNSNYDLFLPFLGVGFLGDFLIGLLENFTDNEFIDNYLGWIFLIFITGIFIYIISRPNEIK